MIIQVIDNPDYTNVVKVGIHCEPDCEPLKFFLSGISIPNLPILVEKAILSEGYGAENTAMLFYGNLDGYDIASGNGFAKDEVEVFNLVFGEVTLKKIFFYQVIFKYAQRVLEMYANTPTVSESWGIALKNKLRELESAIENEV